MNIPILKLPLCALSLLTALGVGPTDPVHAASVDATATALLTSSFEINGGVLPAGLRVSTGQITATESFVTSAIDLPEAITTADSFVQVAIPFTTPPTPFIDTRFSETTVPGGNTADGFFYFEFTQTVDATLNEAGAVTQYPSQLETLATNTSTLSFANATAASEAAGTRVLQRDYVLTNFSDETLVFDLSTSFEATLQVSADNADTVARAEAVASVALIAGDDVTFLYSSTDPYDAFAEADDPSASVTDMFVTSNALFDGANFQSSAQVSGPDSGPEEASLVASSSDMFAVTLGAGDTMRLIYFVSTETSVSFTPPVTEVSLPASALALLLGLGGLAAMRRMRV